MYCLSC